MTDRTQPDDTALPPREEVRALLDAATEGPWWVNFGDEVRAQSSGDLVAMTLRHYGQEKRDAALIALTPALAERYAAEPAPDEVTDAMVEAGARAMADGLYGMVETHGDAWARIDDMEQDDCRAMAHAALTSALAARPASPTPPAEEREPDGWLWKRFLDGQVFGYAGHFFFRERQQAVERWSVEEGPGEPVPVYIGTPPADRFAEGADGGGWRDIASAPRDGTPVLVNDPEQGDRFVAIAWWGKSWDGRHGPDWQGGDGAVLEQPTHWRPLPPPPASAPGQADGGGS